MKGAEYFTHPADIRWDATVNKMEEKFGNTGYAFIFKMVEYMTPFDDFKFPESHLSQVPGEIGFSDSEFKKIFLFAKEMNVPEKRRFIVVKNGFVTSPWITTKLLCRLMDHREKARLRMQEFRARNKKNDDGIYPTTDGPMP